ncbi:polymer-forming cytoskeletal protein [Ruminiclostridium herbifermentans]|uniref:Polymer-forming cytoskeletal protein n=1 Tax=Ruminiclostridium herbifermentans TaxID=2488810 RepID=A0A4U7JK01_9FIRM|nr:polymer-forming cytoskeletal protein [Ruminiclostridium herbifermentans]QNU66565.1 polymer-forming cytoskeletal protein [Ruminiclostridium herbifermentans]
MFNRQTDFEKATFDTLIGSNTELIGDINSKGIIRIDGKITGNISVQGDLFIGEAASIKGNVTASNIHVAGSIDGDVSSSGLLKLLSTAKLLGDIQVKSFICDEGSIFEGNCKMLETQTSKSLLMGKKKDYKKSSVIDEGQTEM